MRFALFDLDHTILPHDTQALFCNFILRRERWRTLLHLVFIPFALLRAFKLVPLALAKRAFSAYLWRMSLARLQQHAREFAEQEVKPRCYPELLAEIQRHRDEGRVLVLNTASPVFYTPDIARVLGFAHCVATPLVMTDPMPLIPKLNGGNNKVERKITNMAVQIPTTATLTAEDRADTWSYSDSAADIPLLDFAGRQVLVHPSATLAAKYPSAIVLRPPRPYSGKSGDMLTVISQCAGLYPAAQ